MSVHYAAWLCQVPGILQWNPLGGAVSSVDQDVYPAELFLCEPDCRAALIGVGDVQPEAPGGRGILRGELRHRYEGAGGQHDLFAVLQDVFGEAEASDLRQ